MNASATRLAPLMGAAFFVLAITGFVISGEPPDAKEPVPKVVDFYVHNDSTVMLGAAISIIAGTCLVFFAAHLRTVLRAREEKESLLPQVAFAGGVIVAIAVAVAVDRTMLFAVAATANDIGPLGVQALNALYGNDFLPFALGMQVLLLAAGVSVIRTQALPRWLGWVAVMLAAVAVSPLGPATLVGGGLWILAASIVMGVRGLPRRGRAAGLSRATTTLVVAGLLALLVTVGVSSAGATAGAKTETLRFFSKDVSTTLTHPDGTVVRRPPYPQPKPSDVLDINSLDYTGNHRHHTKRWSFSHHARCVFTTAQPDCETQAAIGGSLLIIRGYPGTVIDGTGRYQGATGQVLENTEVPGGSDIVARIHLHR